MPGQETPKRVRLRRVLGWRMPAGAVKVDRSTPWGNPFVVGQNGTRAECVALFVHLMAGRLCLNARATLDEQRRSHAAVRDALPELRGRDLACWCALDAPCHADVLLELANG